MEVEAEFELEPLELLPLEEPLLELEPLELELLPPLTLPPRASWPSIWGWVSMKAMVGPATSWVVARSRTLLMRGCLSEVIQIPTGPLMPLGTTQSLNGRVSEKGAPPSIIWQKSV